MKSLFMLVLFVTAQILTAQGQIKPYSTTAKLPGDKIIWPLPDFSEFKYGFQITGKFIEAKPILAVEQGNWAWHTLLIRYKITRPHKKYPYDEISFIVRYQWPTSGSGIKMKALGFPFRNEFMEFSLTQDEQVKHMDFFTINTYKPIRNNSTSPSTF